MKRLLATGLMVLLASATASAGVLTDWNLVVRNNVTSSSEVDGSALIGGNLTGSSNYAVHGVTAPGGEGLAIGGNIVSGSIAINNGGHLRLNGLNGGTVNLNGGGSSLSGAVVPSMVNSAMAEASAISANLLSLTPNGTIDGAGNLSAVPTMIDGQLVAVYYFSAASIQSLGQLNLNIGSAQSVILNVESDNGLVDLIAPPNIIGGFNQANSSRILWNFFDATSVVVNNTFNGAVLAPLADLQVLGGGINGSVVVDNVSAQNAEIRRFTYTGYTPEPGSAMSLLALAGSALYSARRR
jgi:choice-of-anchor A domain-containing protein